MLRSTRLSWVRLSIAAFAVCLLPSLAPAQKAGWRTHELQAFMITLPPSDPGILSALPCSSCNALSFGTTANTHYEIGKESVSLAQLRVQFASYPEALVVVMLGDDLKTVERVVMSAIAPAQ